MELVFVKQNLTSLLLCFIIAMFLYWLWTRRHLYRFSLQVPGLWGLPLIGLFYKINSLESIFPTLEDIFIKCKSNTLCLWVGIYPVLFTKEPEVIEKVLTSTNLLNKAKGFYQPLYNVFEGGLIASPADKWLHNRKLINPSFSHKVLQSFFPTFNKAKELAFSKFDALVDGDEHKLLDILQRISLGISVETTMGKVMKEGDEVDEDLARKWQYICNQCMKQVVFSLLHIDRILYVTSFRYRKTRKDLRNYTNELLQQKLTNSERNNNNQATTDDDDDEAAVIDIKKTSSIFIEQAIKIYKKQQFTWHDMQSESNTIVTASFETTASSTFATLVMLAMHAHVQEKLYQEILSVFPAKDFEMEYEHLEHLPYLDMVVNEVLRLNPSVPLIGRHVVKDTELNKSILLPKDLQIVISIFHLHRRTDIWGQNAAQFNPDNFLPENMQGKHPYAYMPFSKGIRNCIGWRYALFAMKVLIAGLVRNFRFSTTFKFENLRYMDKVTLSFVDEPSIEIHRR